MGIRQPRIHICDSAAELISMCDIVVTTTTSINPVMPDDKKLLSGRCFIGIGSYTPRMREFPNAIWDLVKNVYLEMPFACKESGDIFIPLRDKIINKSRIKYIYMKYLIILATYYLNKEKLLFLSQ